MLDNKVVRLFLYIIMYVILAPYTILITDGILLIILALTMTFIDLSIDFITGVVLCGAILGLLLNVKFVHKVLSYIDKILK